MNPIKQVKLRPDQKKLVQAWLSRNTDKWLCPFPTTDKKPDNWHNVRYVRHKLNVRICASWFPKVKSCREDIRRLYKRSVKTGSCPCQCYKLEHVVKVAKKMLEL